MQIKTENQLQQENEELRARLAETEATLEAIRNGEVDAIVVSGQDGEKIFTLASAETPYRIIIEEMDEGAVSVSEDGIILFCNRRFAELFNTPSNQIVGINIKHFIPDYENFHIGDLFNKSIHDRIKEDISCINNNGEEKYLHLSICVLPQGMLGQICIIVTDITELKKHQQNLQGMVNERTLDLNKVNTELKEINATKDKLFSIIAHDLRGPFTSLLGFSDLMIENIHNYDVDKFEKLLFHINSAAKNAYTLLENLLIWARSQNKQLLFKPRIINISTVILEVISNLSSLAIIKNITLKYKNNSDIAGCADINMLTAIIRNLVSNAIKFCNPGGTIEIITIKNEKGIEVSVLDNGIGMTEQTVNNLFRLEGSKSNEGTAHEKGTGLGLLICKEFVEKHGGTIWVESHPSSGSKFTFTLPN